MSLKNITLVSCSWVLFNSEGDSKILDLDKYSILKRLGIHARDLRILDPLLSYPSTILGRERAIIINLEVLFVTICVISKFFLFFLIILLSFFGVNFDSCLWVLCFSAYQGYYHSRGGNPFLIIARTHLT